MENELINKIAIAELDPKKSYIVEINIDNLPYELFKNIKQGFEKIGITNVLFYAKDRLKITEVKDNSEYEELNDRYKRFVLIYRVQSESHRYFQ